MPSKARRVGKRAELKAAKALGGVKTNILGVSGPDVIDAHGNRVEVKYRTTLPKWLDEIFFSTRADVDYAVLYVKGRRDALVIHRLSKFKQGGQLSNLPDVESLSWGDADSGTSDG